MSKKAKSPYCGRCKIGTPPGTYDVGGVTVVCDHSWLDRLCHWLSEIWFEVRVSWNDPE